MIATIAKTATISAYSGVHQFCRVGQHAFVGGYTVVTRDALPYAKTVGNRARIYGVNAIGLARRDDQRVDRRTRQARTRHAQRRLAARPDPLRAQGLVDGTCAREPQRDAREGPQIG